MKLEVEQAALGAIYCLKLSDGVLRWGRRQAANQLGKSGLRQPGLAFDTAKIQSAFSLTTSISTIPN